MWQVPSDGGPESKLTGYSLEPPYPQNNLVKIPGTDEVLMSYLTKNGGVLARQSLGGGAAQTVVGDSQLISDFDVSPDGTKFGFTRVTQAGPIAFAGDLTNNSAVQEGPWDSTLLRYSNTGSGLLEGGCMDERPEPVRARRARARGRRRRHRGRRGADDAALGRTSSTSPAARRCRRDRASTCSRRRCR